MRLSSFVLGLVTVLLLGGAVAYVLHVRHKRSKPLRRADSFAGYHLRRLAVAQSDFRANDRDRNGINDYWTADVAGLYGLDPGDGALKLIEKSIADADVAPHASSGQPIPYEGYYFRSLERDESVPPGSQDYRLDTRGTRSRGKAYHPAKFAFCMYPARYGERTAWTFVINEDYGVWRTENGGKPVTAWPSAAVLQRDWTRLK